MLLGKSFSLSNILWCVAFFTALAFSLQYPFSSTFPMGGDAVEYVATARETLSFSLQGLLKSHYPLTHTFFSFTVFLPTSWPNRVIIFTTLVHFITALLLGHTVKKFGGTSAAACAIFIWGIATTTINRHFEDGTLAQQFSLIPLLLFIDRLAANKPLSAILFLVATIFSHPITGLLAFLSTGVSLPIIIYIQAQQKRLNRITMIIIAIIILIIFILGTIVIYPRLQNLTVLPTGEEHVTWPNLVRSFFGPFLLIAPLGAIVAWSAFKRLPLATAWLLIFTSLSILSTFNHQLGIGFWTFRLQTYFILSVTFLSSLGLPFLLSRLSPILTPRLIIILLLFTITATEAWLSHRYVYAWYESSSNYGRLHPEELAGINWLQNNLPPNSIIITSTTTRHAEWIDALTHQNWQPLASLSAFARDHIENQNTHYPPKIISLFTRVEDIPAEILEYPEYFTPIYQNPSLIIYQVAHVSNL